MKINLKTKSLLTIAILGFSLLSCSSDDPDNSGESDGMENNGGTTGGDNQGSGDENQGSGDNDQDSPGDDNNSGDNNSGDNSGSGDDNQGSDNENPTPSTKIIFYDDFDSTTGTPDPDKWVLCERASSNWARYLSESYDQAYVKDGSLYLIAERVDGEYKTGGIETRGKFDFQYGTVECRARFVRRPHGNHTGIWMMPAPPTEQWPKSGEIDIMEHLSDESIIYETVHSWYIDDMGHSSPKAQETVSVDNTEWNTYGVIWTSESITYTVNGQEYLSYSNQHLDGENGTYQWPFNHPFYIILSQSLGGEGTWAGYIADDDLPAIFEIDWIKVTQTEN